MLKDFLLIILTQDALKFSCMYLHILESMLKKRKAKKEARSKNTARNSQKLVVVMQNEKENDYLHFMYTKSML
jgi:hypothetical protein